MSKADRTSLEEIHGLLAEYMLLLLKGGKVSAAELAQINQFLKNNDITADLAGNSQLAQIQQELEERRRRRGRGAAKLITVPDGPPADPVDAAELDGWMGLGGEHGS